MLYLVTAVESETEPPMPQVEPPRFLQPITGLDIMEGNEVRFEAVVAGIPEPQVTWLREGEEIKPSSDFQVMTRTVKNMMCV